MDDVILKRDPTRMPCNILGDMERLPFKSSVAGSIICDPPYDYNFTNPELISELVRICKPKGKIIFIAPWIPNHKAIKVLNTDLWNVGSNGAYHKIRTMFYKSNGQLEDYTYGAGTLQLSLDNRGAAVTPQLHPLSRGE